MKKFMAMGVLFLCTFSCTNPPSKDVAISEKMISPDKTAETSSPFLTTNTEGNIVMSWVKEIKDGNTVMCYAVSTDKGNSFGQPTEIPESKGVHSHGENLPKIIFKPNGEIIAVWGASNPNPENEYSEKVFYSQSFDNGKHWGNAVPLVNDTASNDQRYFDLGILKNGEAGITWLDNRTKTKKEGMTLYYSATQGKTGFQNEKPVGETSCQCCRTDLFVNDKGDIHVAYRKIIQDSIRDMVHIVSMDEGKTFSEPIRISPDNWVINGCPHTGPTMAENKLGLHVAWFTAGGTEGVYSCVSTDNGQQFSPRQMVSVKARHPQMATLPNETIGIVWEETIKKDSMVYSNIVLQITTPDGQQTKQNINTGMVNAGFPVLISNNDKMVFVAWVQQDNATSISSGHHQLSKGEQVFYKMILLE